MFSGPHAKDNLCFSFHEDHSENDLKSVDVRGYPGRKGEKKTPDPHL